MLFAGSANTFSWGLLERGMMLKNWRQTEPQIAIVQWSEYTQQNTHCGKEVYCLKRFAPLLPDNVKYNI